MTGLTEQQRAAIESLLADAKPATDSLLLSVAEQIRDRREHDHASAGPDWDWYCLNASGWLGDKAPTVLRRLLDAEARVTELEQQLAAATRRDVTSPLRAIHRHGDMSEQVRREIGDLLDDADPAPYRSSPLPPRDAICAGDDCGHNGAEHHHGDTTCWAHLPRLREANGTWSGIRICPCAAFVAGGVV